MVWAVFLWAAALVLPQLGPHVQVRPTVKVFVATQYALLLIATPVAFVAYLNQAWRRVGAVPNRAAYVIWLSFESIAAMGVLGVLAYGAITFVATRLR